MNTLFTILVILIVIAAILLVAVVLLQNGKDGGLASNFTSANQALGVRQTATILEKATWGLVAFILVLSIVSTFTIPKSTGGNSTDSLTEEILSQGNDAEAQSRTATTTCPRPAATRNRMATTRAASAARQPLSTSRMRN